MTRCYSKNWPLHSLARLHAALSITIQVKALATSYLWWPGTYFGIKNFQAAQHNLPKKSIILDKKKKEKKKRLFIYLDFTGTLSGKSINS